MTQQLAMPRPLMILPASPLPTPAAAAAAHELGHLAAARARGLELSPPLFIPAGLGLLGSFGAITRIKSFVPDRTALAAVGAAGPLAGAALSAAVMVAGAVLTAQQVGGVELDVASFRCVHAWLHWGVRRAEGRAAGSAANCHSQQWLLATATAPCHTCDRPPLAWPPCCRLPACLLPACRESLLAGALGQAVFGERLFSADAVDVNPFFVAGWAGLIINSINLLPVGELDGQRVFLGLFGRRAAARMGAGAAADRGRGRGGQGEEAGQWRRCRAEDVIVPAVRACMAGVPAAAAHSISPWARSAPPPPPLLAVTLLLLGLFGFSNSLSLFWLVLVVTLQRGPVTPCDNELSPITDPVTRSASIAALLLPLLVLLPFPAAISFTNGLPDLPPTF